MSTDLRSINAKWFSLLAGEDIETWNLALDAKVQHKVYGLGKIFHIEHRNNYSPMITLVFSNEVKHWPPKSFDNGKTTLVIYSEIAIQAEKMMQEYIKSTELKIANELAIKAEIESKELEAITESKRRALLSPEELREDNHKTQLMKKDKTYHGVRKALSYRTTHCYACKSNLSSKVDVECVACGWLLCNCGACGC